MIDVFAQETVILALSFLGIMSVLLAIGIPLLQTDKRSERLRTLSKHSENLSEQMRSELAERRAKARTETKVGLMRKFLQGFKLETLTAHKKTRERLMAAGWRSRSAMITFVFSRFAFAAGLSVFSILVLPFLEADVSFAIKLLIICLAAVIGYYLPSIWVQNLATKRRQELSLYYPEALDLLGICVNGGQSIEAAFNRVSEDIFDDSPIMSEEIGLTAAELAFLGDRTTAYRNFATRTDLPPIKSLSTTLSQSEKYGTPLSQALNVLSDENRKERMTALEKKAASLPAKLTVPMIVFFLPVLFVVILAPAGLTFL